MTALLASARSQWRYRLNRTSIVLRVGLTDAGARMLILERNIVWVKGIILVLLIFLYDQSARVLPSLQSPINTYRTNFRQQSRHSHKFPFEESRAPHSQHLTSDVILSQIIHNKMTMDAPILECNEECSPLVSMTNLANGQEEERETRRREYKVRAGSQ